MCNDFYKLENNRYDCLAKSLSKVPGNKVLKKGLDNGAIDGKDRRKIEKQQ